MNFYNYKAIIIYFVSSCGFIVTHGRSFEETKSTYAYFWHVTDFHYDANYSIGFSHENNIGHPDLQDYFTGSYPTEICWGKGKGYFGDYNCDSSISLIKSATNFIKLYSEEIEDGKVSFILWTGDDTAHVDNKYSNQLLTLDIIKMITEELVKTELPIIPILGNHDAYPHNQFSDNDNNILYQNTAELWKDIGLTDNAYKEYKENGGFYTMEWEKFYFIGVNTNLWYRSNHYEFTNPDDPMGQFEWLESKLEQARNSLKNVILFAHIPPGKFERFYQYFEEEQQQGFPWLKPKYNSKFLDILIQYSDIIPIQLYGHHHTDTFKLIRDKNGNVVSVGLLAPAVTPGKSTLAPETGANNPSLRLFKYDTSTGMIVDYEQFWVNLTATFNENYNDSNAVEIWESEYIFSEYYETSTNSFGPQAFEEIYEKLKSEKIWFNKYFEANTVQKVDEVCDNYKHGEIVCKSFHLCAISEQDYDKFENCVKESVLGYAPLLPKSTTERADSFAMKIVNYSTLIVINVFLLLLIK